MGEKQNQEGAVWVMELCKKDTYNITAHGGQCLPDCPHGAWNAPEGICGAECLKCGGTLYLTNMNQVYCDGCGIQKVDSD